MRPQYISGTDPGVLSAWQQQVAQSTRHPSLQRELLDRQGELLPRFGEQFQRLSAMPRRMRRGLQRHWKQSLAGVALLLALGAQPAMAATIKVGGSCTLVRAIFAANNATTGGGCVKGSVGADTIVLPRNSTQLLRTVNNTRYGPTGLPPIRSTITITGNGSTIRRARAAPEFRIFAVSSTGDLTLQRATVTGGELFRDVAEARDGGGMLNRGALTVRNSAISGNTARNGGGVSSDGTLTITHSIISDNSALFAGGVNNNGTLTITRSTISHNTAGSRSVGGAGGGVLNNFGELTLANSTISGNFASSGGGVNNNDGTLIITNSTISGNNADDESGGVRSTGSSTITNSTISGNSAERRGGGVSNFDTLILARTLISGNTAGSGAEIFDYRNTGGTLNASNFNVFGHHGLTNAQAFGDFTPGPSDITATSDGNTPTALTAILNTTLANNRGSTKTHALVTGSPAIDTVNDGTCPPPAEDQRGISRPQDGNGDGGVACDTGAFETAPAKPIRCDGQSRVRRNGQG